MVELKFKAHIHKSKQIVDVEWIDFNNKRITFNNIDFKYFGLVEEAQFGEFDLLQFTGLKDINGVDIYTGHLVTSQADGETWASSLVVFEKGMFCFKDDYPNILAEYEGLEVIGNIYQTPELENGFKD